MEDKRIVFTNADGGLSVVVPAPRFCAECRAQEKSDEEILAAVIAGAVPAGAAYEVVDASVIPADRTYRDAWRLTSGKTIEVDPAKSAAVDAARAGLQRLRAERQRVIEGG